jgi:hypothetical protein
MSIHNILVPNNLKCYVNAVSLNTDTITATQITTDNIDTTTINGQPYPPASPLPAAQPNTVLIADQNNNLAFQKLTPNKVNVGTANQILHTNAAASAVEWTSDLVVPGNLQVNGTSQLGDIVVNNAQLNGITNIAGPLNLNGQAGNTGDVLTINNQGNPVYLPPSGGGGLPNDAFHVTANAIGFGETPINLVGGVIDTIDFNTGLYNTGNGTFDTNTGGRFLLNSQVIYAANNSNASRVPILHFSNFDTLNNFISIPMALSADINDQVTWTLSQIVNLPADNRYIFRFEDSVPTPGAKILTALLSVQRLA